jgi:hypothetical protein
MTQYYYIQNNSIVSGPHSDKSQFVKKITRCGSPEKLDLITYGFYPEVRDILGKNQKHGEKQLEAKQVRVPAINKTPEELEQEEIINKEMMEITRLQARLTLIEVSLWDSVVAYFNDTNSRTAEELAFWEDAPIWKRNDPIIINSATTLGISEEQLDSLFTLAQTK